MTNEERLRATANAAMVEMNEVIAGAPNLGIDVGDDFLKAYMELRDALAPAEVPAA